MGKRRGSWMRGWESCRSGSGDSWRLGRSTWAGAKRERFNSSSRGGRSSSRFLAAYPHLVTFLPPPHETSSQQLTQTNFTSSATVLRHQICPLESRPRISSKRGALNASYPSQIVQALAVLLRAKLSAYLPPQSDYGSPWAPYVTAGASHWGNMSVDESLMEWLLIRGTVWLVQKTSY